MVPQAPPAGLMPGPDRYAILTRTEYGEQIAFGADPGVTDAERAAAGRETVTERARSLLDENRRSAAQRDGEVPDDGQPVLRIWRPRDLESLRARLSPATPVTVWAEDDALHALYQATADEVQLIGGLQAPMWQVPGADDLWEASFRMYRLDEAIVSITAMPLRAGEPRFGVRIQTEPVIWRGPRAPSLPSGLARVSDDHGFPGPAL